MNHIETVHTPDETVRAKILNVLLKHNASKVGESSSETVALTIRDDNSSEIVGGLYGEIYYRWLFIELFALPEGLKGQGLGSRLITMAQELALEKGCIGIWLDTFDFQAPDFYKRHGFEEFGQLSEYPTGHERYFFKKSIA